MLELIELEPLDGLQPKIEKENTIIGNIASLVLFLFITVLCSKATLLSLLLIKTIGK